MAHKLSHVESLTKGQLKYKQTDITCFFGNSKMKKYNDKKIKTTSITKVVIKDSDESDFETCENVFRNIKRKKPKLPFPISDDEDSMDGIQTNNVTTMMSLNKPKKACRNEETYPDATSTPLKANIQQFNDQTFQNTPNNSRTSSDDTIILDESVISDVGQPKILQNIVISPRDGSKKKSKTQETTENMPEYSPEKHDMKSGKQSKQTYSFVERNLELKVKINLSLQSDEGKTKIETDINVPSDMRIPSQSNSPAQKSDILLKVIDLKSPSPTKDVPSTSGQSNFSDRKISSLKAKKKLFDRSTAPKKSTFKINLGSPEKGKNRSLKNESQITKKKIAVGGLSSPMKQISATKSDASQLKPEEEDQKLNFKNLDCIKELFSNSLKDDSKRKLLLATDVEIIEEFLQMNVHYQYLLMKLFLYVPKWYNIIKFCEKVKLDQKLSPKEVTEMYNYLNERKYVRTDIASLDVDILLDMLLLIDLKQISAKFRLGKYNGKKDLIQSLKKNCRTQSTLSCKKSTEDLLKEAAVERLGFCVKLRDDIKKTFYKAYLLQTFTNLLYIDPQCYLRDLNNTYPEYSIEGYTPFSNRAQFSSFYVSLLLTKEYLDASDKNNRLIMKNYCDTAFEKLRHIATEEKWPRDIPDYLQRFSAEYQYIYILSSASKHLMKYYESVRNWMEFLIKYYPSHYALGVWYKQLAHVLVQYQKDYELAAKTVIEALSLNKKKCIFCSVTLYDLSVLATKIRTTKSYKVCALFCDKLVELSDLPIRYDNFPVKTISGHTDRSGKPGRRIYSFVDENDETNFGNVEMIVLKDYQKEEGYEGIHCEGSLLALLFTLFFWDIIYHYYVPNTFISKFQQAPLDMYTDYFYKNRKTEIDQRLEDIAEKWSSERITKFLKENWDIHSHEKSITKLDSVTANYQELLRMFICIDRKVLSKIFKRLVINFKIFHSGLPDLFLWKSDLAKCKFVEVKGEGDKLSHKQILWIQYLIDIGADVEVCHVSGVGSRKMKISKISE